MSALPTDKDAEAYIQRHLAQLPRRFNAAIGRVRVSGTHFTRPLISVLLIAGGLFWFMLLLGLWMLQLGLVLLADNVPAAKRWLVGQAICHERWWRRGR